MVNPLHQGKFMGQIKTVITLPESIAQMTSKNSFQSRNSVLHVFQHRHKLNFFYSGNGLAGNLGAWLHASLIKKGPGLHHNPEPFMEARASRWCASLTRSLHLESGAMLDSGINHLDDLSFAVLIHIQVLTADIAHTVLDVVNTAQNLDSHRRVHAVG